MFLFFITFLLLIIFGLLGWGRYQATKLTPEQAELIKMLKTWKECV
jgi:hypothetical protein